MEDIPFEKVTIEEAMNAVGKDTPPAPLVEWNAQSDQYQRMEPQNASTLTRETFQWLTKLPLEARPLALAQQFPRVTNRIAELWKWPMQCERYLEGLIIDERGNRKGFPPDVTIELTTLKIHFNTHVAPMHFGVWGECTGR